MRIRWSRVWFAVVTLTVLGGGVAAACTTPNWVTVEPAELGPGTQVDVAGGGYDPGEVDVRWDGMEGTSLGTATAGADGRFTTTVTIPSDATAGRASVVAVQRAADGTRLWGYTDIVLPDAPAAPPLLPAAVAAGALLLIAVGAATVIASRRRCEPEQDSKLEAELQALLDGTGSQQDREPAPLS